MTRAPSPAALAALVALAAASALWALFLWSALLVSRAGGTPFCALGAESDCAALWDSAFASAVHARTGLPLAGWGMAWGLVAFALPLIALVRPLPVIFSGVRLVAGGGVVAVFVMLAVSAGLGAFCGSCAVSYLLVGGYAGIALFGWQGVGLPEPGRAAALAAAGTLGAFLLLLYPGARTPWPMGRAGRDAISVPRGTGDAALRELVGSLSPPLRQTLSDSLDLYRRSPLVPPATPRSLEGAPDAPVRITEFTDVRCGHCAELQRTLEALREHLPAGSFSVEPRQFPLDAECNPLVKGKGRDPVRCLAARARICLEGSEGAPAFASALFEAQKTLTDQRVFALAAPYVPRARLEACVTSAETGRKLADDVAYAARFDPDGAPLVIVNGRRGTSFGPFLYAMALTGGADSHPAFASLPPPDPAAHLH